MATFFPFNAGRYSVVCSAPVTTCAVSLNDWALQPEPKMTISRKAKQLTNLNCLKCNTEQTEVGIII